MTGKVIAQAENVRRINSIESKKEEEENCSQTNPYNWLIIYVEGEELERTFVSF